MSELSAKVRDSITVGDFVAFNVLPDATWFIVLETHGPVLIVREANTRNAPERSDRSLVAQTSPYRPLTADELAQIVEFAAIEGARWKAILQRESWWRGIPTRAANGREYPALCGLRNSHGPSWLLAFKLPA